MKFRHYFLIGWGELMFIKDRVQSADIPGWRDVWVDKGLLPNPVSSTNIQTSFLGHPTPRDELGLKRSLLISIESFNHCCPVSLYDCQSLSIMSLKVSNLSAGVSRAKRSLLTKSQALSLPLSLQGHQYFSQNIDKVSWQDKVNYAVSEREDRVTDVTTITGWRAVLGCTGLQLGCTEL